ncbi:glycosyltransferase family 92 protein [Pedobacter endophyticus]|uniref:Glycosyltransferase family 92 protein n=1 Tax=Pedobacter endophyticus TaxID=2789740 RepID=A0A7U3SQ81_9SPHI|nr:glycosyltransferase family 92 protein [Pedobacter endophyticus]QPH38826.1 glycosyltransferase family 92 protein [Pedobacter endophyticus]
MNKTVASFLTTFIPNRSKKEKWNEILTKINLADVTKKGLAEIVAGLIPHKMTRNQWRGILRYGPFSALKLMASLPGKKNIKPDYYLAVCAIAKNEGPYFEEWIEWHRKLGVEKFYIYDNESTDNTRQILEPYISSGMVEYTLWPGMKQQLMAYDNCLEKHRLDARWIAFIDLDEFIFPVKDSSIPRFLKRFEDFSAVEINWLIYGSGGAKVKEAGKVMDRFKHHAKPEAHLNRHVKSIVNPRKVFSFIGCHEVARISGSTADSHGETVTQNFWYREPKQDIIHIKHYAVKSYEEFLDKRARGRARSITMRNLDYFNDYDLNDIED